MPCRLDGLNIVLDCANGAACEIAPPLFERLGAKVHGISCSPDGRNINLNCGALHLDKLREEVVRSGADLGIAFDGDADRCMMVAAFRQDDRRRCGALDRGQRHERRWQTCRDRFWYPP